MNVADRASVAPSVRMTSSAENVRPALPHVGRQRFAQSGATVVGRIVRVAAVQRSGHLGANHIGRGKIGLAERERNASWVLGSERVNPTDAGGLERGKRGVHGQTHGVPFVRVALG